VRDALERLLHDYLSAPGGNGPGRSHDS
jgi:hypothetical protein